MASAADGGDSPRSPPFGLWIEHCPSRLRDVPKELVDDHTQIFLPMVNDTDRNDFFWHALEAAGVEGKKVLDIGAGSGILSLMAAKLGARRVVGVEECGDLVNVARRNVASNGYEGVVEIVHGLAADLELDEPADILVTETLGTWMTCEGIVQYCEDARRRLLKKGATILPCRGTQFVVLIECKELERLVWIQRYRGLDLSGVMGLMDTASPLWSKRLGVMPSGLAYRELCEPIPVLSADFSSTPFAALPSGAVERRVVCAAGTVHAALDFWVVEDAQGRQLSTNPRARHCQPWRYARDLAWGNGLQLMADEPAPPALLSSTGSAPTSQVRETGDARWASFLDADDSSAGSQRDVPATDASDLDRCRSLCLFFGFTGFVVEAGQALFLRTPRELLLEPSGRVASPGRTLHVVKVALGEPARLSGKELAAQALPQPLRVAEAEQVRVITAYQAEHRSAQTFVLRVLNDC